MKAACPICAERTDRILTRTLRRGQGIVFHCAACDLGFLVTMSRELVDPDGVYRGYYSTEYRKYVSHRSDGAATTPKELFEVYRNYQTDRVRMVSQYLKHDSKILEIGASAGQFLWHMDMCNPALGTSTKLYAIEPDAACCDFMEEMGIETDSNVLRDSKFSCDKFDIICSFQTMEHVDEPVEFLREVRALMKPDSVAFIEVPNLYDPLRSVWGIPEYEQFYFHRDHLWYFSEKSLKAVAWLAGFSNPEVRFTQDYSILNHLHWLMTRTPQSDCHIGLGPVKFKGKDTGMAAWLSGKLASLNAEYVSMLESAGQTSNLMLVLTN